MKQNYDVAIIGGGIIGSSIAAHLANENLNIAIINSTSLGTPASNASAGLLMLSHLTEHDSPLLKGLCFKSFDYFPKFYETIKSGISTAKINLGFRELGSLHLIFSNLEIAQKENQLRELKSNVKVSFLNKQEILKHESYLTKDILGAYYCPNDRLINNIKFLKAISAYCINNKVSFLNTEVQEINLTKNKIESIVLANKETISAHKYVLCNGAWANKFLKKIYGVNENLIKAIKGEILQVGTSRDWSLQKIIFCDEGYLLPREATNQFERSSILIGSTLEEVNIEENNHAFQNTILGISSLSNLFKKVIPNHKDYYIMNKWAGLRPQTKDKLPILGKTDGVENLYCGLGHYRNGVLTGPFSGKLISDLILGNTLEYDIKPFNLDRINKLLNVVSLG